MWSVVIYYFFSIKSDAISLAFKCLSALVASPSSTSPMPLPPSMLEEEPKKGRSEKKVQVYPM